MLKVASIIGVLLAIGLFMPGSTSYVAPTLILTPEPLTILIVGDMMFDRYVRMLMDEHGYEYPFQKIRLDADIVVGNLEGTITTNKSIAKRDNLKFTFDPKIVEPLKRFTAVSLANNHSRDFGYKGYTDTIKYLKDAGIGYFGDWENVENLSYTIEKKGKTIEFIGFNEFPYKNYDKVLTTVASSTADYIIVIPHWGVEYEKLPSTLQKTWARKFIDAGADAVIGAHPHVVQTTETYKHKPIVYSMGNFIFDQYANDAVKTGMMVKITLKEVPVIEQIKVYAEKSQPALSTP